MAVKLFHVDAFADGPFTGNPAAVCLLDKERPDAWMQSIAAEMNLSETAFLTKRSPNLYNLRWMTPTVEVDLCGHATLASAHVLFTEGIANEARSISFFSKSGPLAAEIRNGMIELNFPVVQQGPIESLPETIANAIPATPIYIGKGQFDYLIEVIDEETLRSMQPDFALLRQHNARGVVVTAKADKGSAYDFVSRGFYGAAGIDEDPVTGSAHCMLGPYWMARLGKLKMNAYQASPRGGAVRLQVDDRRVKLGGHAVTISKGELMV